MLDANYRVIMQWRVTLQLFIAQYSIHTGKSQTPLYIPIKLAQLG